MQRVYKCYTHWGCMYACLYVCMHTCIYVCIFWVFKYNMLYSIWKQTNNTETDNRVKRRDERPDAHPESEHNPPKLRLPPAHDTYRDTRSSRDFIRIMNFTFSVNKSLDVSYYYSIPSFGFFNVLLELKLTLGSSQRGFLSPRSY